MDYALGPPPPTAPPPIECPSTYGKHLTACYRFGTHLSFAGAQMACEAEDAKLAQVDQINTKYLKEKIAQWGGNDFFIGSFIERGRMVKKKGSAACPIIKGQNMGGLFGTVDCNSANRYICQIGETQRKMDPAYNPYLPDFPGGDAQFPGNRLQPFPFSTTTKTTTESTEAASSGTSPVVFVVVAILVIIVLLIALRLLFKRYKAGKNDPFKRNKDEKKKMAELVEKGGGEKLNSLKKVDAHGNKLVFSATSRKENKLKSSTSESADSACPPSNTSETNDKPMPLPLISLQGGIGRPLQSDIRPSRMASMIGSLQKSPKRDKNTKDENEREGRAKDKSRASRQRSKSAYRREDESPTKARRRNSDPRDESRRGRRRSSSSESSETSDEEYRHHPKRVYQRGHSRRHGSSGHYGSRHESRHMREYGSHRRHHRSRRHHGYGDRGSSRHNHYDPDGYHSLGHHRSRGHMQAHANSSFVHNPPPPRYPEVQYFPQPPKLMSMVESQLKNINETQNNVNNNDMVTSRMSAMEPIRVNRQIYEKHAFGNEAILASAAAAKARNKDTNPENDPDHLYESLDDTKATSKIHSSNKSGDEGEMLADVAI